VPPGKAIKGIPGGILVSLKYMYGHTNNNGRTGNEVVRETPGGRADGGEGLEERATARSGNGGRRGTGHTAGSDLFTSAKAAYTIRDVWSALDLQGTPSANCRSPFRDDTNPSFSIYNENRKWKDHGTGEGGDVIEFIRTALGGNHSDVRDWLMEKLPVALPSAHRAESPKSPPEPDSRPHPALLLDLQPGTEVERRRLAGLRDISMTGIAAAVAVGILGFTNWHGRPCYAVTDSTRRAAEIRALDGEGFRNSGADLSKAAPLSGVDKSWLPGAVWLDGASPETSVLLTEGATDLLTAIDLYTDYRKHHGGQNGWVPVTLLGAHCKRLDPECAKLIGGRHVRIVADGDKAGDQMKEYWAQLLRTQGCRVDTIDMPEGKDLSDIARLIEPTDLFS
jgi:hypothetical protein